MPSLVLILLAVSLAYFVLPQFAPAVMISSSLIVLAISLYLHWSQFGTAEYERSTWQNHLRQFGGLIMMATLILLAYGYHAMNTPNARGFFSSPEMPALTVPTLTGGGPTSAVASVVNTASSRIRELMRRGRITLE